MNTNGARKQWKTEYQTKFENVMGVKNSNIHILRYIVLKKKVEAEIKYMITPPAKLI